MCYTGAFRKFFLTDICIGSGINYGTNNLYFWLKFIICSSKIRILHLFIFILAKSFHLIPLSLNHLNNII
nr:MAG TPA: hypothetical protein [Caudoviricetes sp.]